jgi:hypothetical protein
MGKATGIIASIGLTLGSMLASHFMSDGPAAANAKAPVPAPWNITSLDDLQRVRNQQNQQVMNPATGKPDAYGTVQAWVEQTEAGQQEQSTQSGRTVAR